MAFLLSTRLKLRRALYHMLGSSATDAALTEHDTETLEQANYYVQHGVWRAQRFLIEKGYAGWRATATYGSGGTAWSGSDAVDGGRYAALPADFLRVNGDQHRSALRDADRPHVRWGTYVPEEETLPDRYGAFYAVRGTGSQSGKLWLARGAQEPTSLLLDYFYKHALLDDDADVPDLPEECAPLVVAHAADMAADDSWLAEGDEARGRIARALGKAQDNAARFVRPDRGPRVLHARPAFNGRWL